MNPTATPATVRPRPGAAALPTSTELVASQRRLAQMTRVQAWVAETRCWTPQGLAALGVGWGNPGLPCRGNRFLLPMYDQTGMLVNVRGYMPNSSRKMVGLRGRPVDLWPQPERLWPTTGELWLVEGEPDAITARCAWPTRGVVAVPGVATWRREWSARLARFSRLHLLFDADDAGGALTARAARDLDAAGASVEIHTWAALTGGTVPAGYDVTDWVRDHPFGSLPHAQVIHVDTGQE